MLLPSFMALPRRLRRAIPSSYSTNQFLLKAGDCDPIRGQEEDIAPKPERHFIAWLYANAGTKLGLATTIAALWSGALVAPQGARRASRRCE